MGEGREPQTVWIYEPENRRGNWSVWKMDEINGVKVNESAKRMIDKEAYDKLQAELVEVKSNYEGLCTEENRLNKVKHDLLLEIAQINKSLDQVNAENITLRSLLAKKDESAARWDALMSSQRIRFIGSAVLGTENQHLGLELWETYPGDHHTAGKESLIKYADGIRSRQALAEMGVK